MLTDMLTRRIVGEVVRWYLAFGVVHTLTASMPVKKVAERVAGPRYRAGLYRVVYNAQALVTLGLLGWKLWRLPDRELFRVPPPFSWLMRLGQVALLALAAWTVWAIGLWNFSGLSQLLALVAGREVQTEPEAQSPYPNGEGMSRNGPFAYTRHPANWSLLGILLLFPRVTVKGLAVGVLNAAYLVAGSVHEDYRMRTRYGDVYRRYEAEVPFLV